MKNKNGFSLIEFIVVIVIISIIFAAGARLLLELVDASALHSRRKEISDSSRIAADRMIREIRRIKDKTSLIAASGASIQFLDTNNNNITFGVSGTTLQRTVNGTTNALADNVSSLSFTYYDSNGAVLTPPLILSPSETNLRMVEVGITFTLGGTQLSFAERTSPRRLQ